MGGAAKTEGVGFNQQQAVGNEITIPPLSDWCHVSLFGAWTSIQTMTGMHDMLAVLLSANKPKNMQVELEKQNQTRTARKPINAGTTAHTETTLAQHIESI